MRRAIFPHARSGWPRVVIRVPDLAVFEQMHGLTLDDSPLIMCDVGSRELCSLDLQLP